MTVTIRCSCGNHFTIEDGEPATPETDCSPGDFTTQPQHHGYADTGLGFTTPALTTEEP